MSLTEEQQSIIEYEGDLAAEAVAGSGKSYTILQYCKRRPHAPTLYMAYNRTVRLEAIAKFRKEGLKNVRVETMHSLAYKELEIGKKYTVLEKGQFRPLDIVDILKLNKKKDLQFSVVIARHVLNFLAYYFNSVYRQIHQAREDYLDTLFHTESRHFVETHFDKIAGYAEALFKKMYHKEIEITHDAYLKLYLMGNPALPYKYIHVDESQDSSYALVDMLYRQKATRILVGDPHQSIYGFRHCCNAMEILGFPKFPLSTSFRFGQNIANLGMDVLLFKERVGFHLGESVKIIGAGDGGGGDQVGVLARNNISLIAQAILDMEDGLTTDARIGFEGGIDAYTCFANGGGNLYDVLWLFCNKHERITDPFIKSFGSFGDLTEYQKEVDDPELNILIGIVTAFGPDLFTHIKNLRSRQVKNRAHADIIYSTTHRAKGLDYREVMLVGFIDQWDIEDVVSSGEYPKRSKKDIADGKESQGINEGLLTEEINCHYVAVTRARKEVTTLPDPIEMVNERKREKKKKAQTKVSPG